MRKTKEECLDLPVISRRMQEIKPDRARLDEYNELVEKIKSSKKSSHHGHHGFGNSSGGSNILEIMSKLRYIASVGKVVGVSQWLSDHFYQSSNKDTIVVFVWFKDTATSLRDAMISISSSSNRNCQDSNSNSMNHSINWRSDSRTNCNRHLPISCEILTGDVDFQSRQALVDKFQSGNLNVLICTYGVGSTGLTLTRSHTVVLVDRPWSPGDLLQAEDRIRRIGRLQVYFMQNI